MKKWMILIAAITVISLLIVLSAFAQSKLEPYSRGGTEFTSVFRMPYLQYDYPRYSPSYLTVPTALPPQVSLQPYSRGGTDFTALQPRIFAQYDYPRYNPSYLNVPTVLPPQVGLEPYAPVQPLDNEHLRATKD